MDRSEDSSPIVRPIAWSASATLAGSRYARHCRLSRRPKRAWDEFFAKWDDLDRALARQCAELLDALARNEGPPPGWRFRAPLFEDLIRQVERWALKAILVSERPREFWQFPLPRLTFLYGFYPIMVDELQSSSIAATEVNVVSDADLRFTIITQCSGSDDQEQIDLIKCWAKNQKSTGQDRHRVRRSTSLRR
jgi:hypothetical protein